MEKVMIGIIILELILLGVFKKVRKYAFVMTILDITTLIIYFLFMNISFIRENSALLIDKIIILILSLSIALLIDTIFVALIQKISEHRIIKEHEKKYQYDRFEYYRDILKEKSPGILSICYNTRKPNFKDTIVSILLYLQYTRMIEIENGNIRIIGDISTLKNHEKIVLDCIEYKHSQKLFKEQFYTSLMEDAKREQYIFTEDQERANMTIFAQMVIVIMIISILILLFALPSLGALLTTLNMEPKLLSLIFLAYFLFFVSIPIYQWIEKNINLMVRTERGFELCGKLKGLKKFLRDFSKLSDSQIKEMQLYDEYVIYCVLFNLKGKLDKESNRLYKKIIIK